MAGLSRNAADCARSAHRRVFELRSVELDLQEITSIRESAFGSKCRLSCWHLRSSAFARDLGEDHQGSQSLAGQLVTLKILLLSAKRPSPDMGAPHQGPLAAISRLFHESYGSSTEPEQEFGIEGHFQAFLEKQHQVQYPVTAGHRLDSSY